MTAKMLMMAAVIVAAAGCATTAPPTERLASTDAAIRSARELGAQQDPQASLHLRLADDQVMAARRLMKDGENERAIAVLERASSDAELAVMITRERAAKTEAAKANQALDAVKAGANK